MNESSRQSMKLVSDSDRQIYDIVNYVFLMGAISLFGVVFNLMNIVVFYKQGFRNTMNISFFGLAIADLGGLITLIWCGICQNPLFMNSDVPMVTPEIQYLTAGAPHTCCARITGWITVFITAERCLCITLPLKIKQIITPRRTTMIVCVIYVVMALSYLPEYVTTYFDWKFYPERNRTLLGLAFTRNRKSVEGLIFILHSILGSVSFIAVIIFTIVLVVQLKHKSNWRREANVNTVSSDAISVRDRRTSSTVVIIATILIVCYTPGVVVSIVTFSEPEFTIVGKFVNAFFVLWSCVFIFEALNSSVNIFLYYNMSSKYRETFCQVFTSGARRFL